MIITTSMPVLVFALVTTGAIPAQPTQAQAIQEPAIRTVTTVAPLHTDTPWLDSETMLAVGPAPGYLENREPARKTTDTSTATKCSACA